MIFNHNKDFLNSKKYDFHFRKWFSNDNSDILIIAIHGYNAHSGSFERPANLFSKFNINTISFDLRGFGLNKDFGEWFSLEVHVNDVYEIIKKICKKEPNKKIFLLGESMGGAIAISLVNKKKDLPLEGLILVSPALWNFSEANPVKSFIMKSFSNLFPNFRISGEGIIKVRPSDNLEMLKNYAIDPLVVHDPTAQSLSGIIDLMDKAYEQFQIFIKNPTIQTLIVIPGIDEIVPRKPMLHLLKNIDIYRNLNKDLFLALYDKNFHMIMRDLDGDRISWEIKEWIIDKKRVLDFQTFKNVLQRLENSTFYHKLD
ncbi:lysophospholipase [Rickettsiales bacterium]|nr:lysophospholipase [Rickettsiales bacterium]